MTLVAVVTKSNDLVKRGGLKASDQQVALSLRLARETHVQLVDYVGGCWVDPVVLDFTRAYAQVVMETHSASILHRKRRAYNRSLSLVINSAGECRSPICCPKRLAC